MKLRPGLWHTDCPILTGEGGPTVPATRRVPAVSAGTPIHLDALVAHLEAGNGSTASFVGLPIYDTERMVGVHKSRTFALNA